MQVFATASYDDHKNIVLLAFEVIEKILRDYFPYITETETTTFTDCVNCLVAFTNSRFNKDISLNAIAFLRFCAAKLAEGDIGASARYKNKEAFANNGPPSPHIIKDEKQDPPSIINKDDHLHFWFPLLAGEIDSFLLILGYQKNPMTLVNEPFTRVVLNIFLLLLQVYQNLPLT